MMTRRSPFSVKDNNINDTTPRRSTRVSARKLIKAYGSASSKSPTVPPPIPAMTKTRGGIITRKRRVTLSPSSSPSYRKMKAASEQGTASTDTHTPSSITKIIPSKKRRSTVTSSKKPPKRPKIGRWEKWEQIAFLQGLREHGRGHWKTIAESIPTRTTVQVKTHAQVELKKLDGGFNIFDELDEFLGEQNEGTQDREEEEEQDEGFSVNENIYETPKRKCIRRQPKKKVVPPTSPCWSPSTPIASNKSSVKATVAPTPPAFLTFSSSSSMTTTLAASALARHPPHQWSHPMTRLALHPLLTSAGAFPSSLFPLSHQTMAGVSFPFSNFQHPVSSSTSSLFATSPYGATFGAFEAANALLGLSTSADGGNVPADEVGAFARTC